MESSYGCSPRCRLLHHAFFIRSLGNRGQSTYAASGAFQDALASHRRSLGLKAVTVDLGVMRDIGVIAEKGATDVLKEWQLPFGMRENEFHALMKNVIAHEMTSGTKGDTATASKNGVSTQIIHGLATGETARAAGVQTPFYFSDPRFSHLASKGASSNVDATAAATSGQGESASVGQQLAEATSLADATSAVTDALAARVAKSLQTDKTDIDPSRPLHSYGIDSLVGVEIANWVFKETKVGVSVLDVLATTSMSDFAGNVAKKCVYCEQK